jgi:hypothetical protein
MSVATKVHKVTFSYSNDFIAPIGAQAILDRGFAPFVFFRGKKSDWPLAKRPSGRNGILVAVPTV